MVHDVCLILEGTYPYRTGGVGHWVAGLLHHLSSLDFALVHLGVGDAPTGSWAYTPPVNLHELVYVPLNRFDHPEQVEEALPQRLTLPRARLYHALSTGFAGLLGLQLKQQTGRPFLLTEHGIYWREIEAGAGELECGFQVIRDGAGQPALQARRPHWAIAFQELARRIYAEADWVTTVSESGRRLQLRLGAPPQRTQVIPNGVDLNRFGGPARRLPPQGPYHVGLVGRVVPLKDVVTFIRAAYHVTIHRDDVYFWVVGPTNHTPDYAARCQELVQRLGLSDRLTLVGEMDPAGWYRQFHLLTLTSRSESLPLALLEGMAGGLPVVATHVGDLPALVYGRWEAGDRLGTAGVLAPPGDHQAIARAILRLLDDKRLYRHASRTARERIRRFYRQEPVWAAYQALYQRFLADPRSPEVRDRIHPRRVLLGNSLSLLTSAFLR